MKISLFLPAYLALSACTFSKEAKAEKQIDPISNSQDISIDRSDFKARYHLIKTSKVDLANTKASSVKSSETSVEALSIFNTPDLALGEVFQVKPILETRSDLFGYLLDLVPQDVTRSFNLYKPYKKIEDFPNLNRYTGREFDEVRNAFNLQCGVAAKEKNQLLMAELSANINTIFDSQSYKAADSKFDEFCLSKIDEVPDEILAVAGVLFYDDFGSRKAFCSATAIGPSEILTSKHCFIQSNGQAYNADGIPDFETKLEDKKVYFYPLGGAFTGKGINVHTTPKTVLNKYEAYEDKLILGLDTAVPNHAKTNRPPVGKRPIFSYVVGNTDLVVEGQTKFDRVRASLPKSCAIVEVTSKGCAYHTCQTGHSTSGAGILTLNADKSVNLLATHKGVIGTSQGCEAGSGFYDLDGENLNVGILP